MYTLNSSEEVVTEENVIDNIDHKNAGFYIALLIFIFIIVFGGFTGYFKPWVFYAFVVMLLMCAGSGLAHFVS